VQRAPLLFGEVITFVVNHQVDNCPVGQGCGLVENEPALLDARSKTAHVPTVRVSQVPGKRSGCKMKPLDLVGPSDSLGSKLPGVRVPESLPPELPLSRVDSSQIYGTPRKSGARGTILRLIGH
jgi:hypothetical protein